MEEVWQRSGESGSALLVLLALAHHASDDAVAWPKIETLVARTRLGERYLRRLLARLADAGEIAIEAHPTDRRRHLYRLDRYRPRQAADTGPRGPLHGGDGGPPGPLNTGPPGPPSTGPRGPQSPDQYRTSSTGEYRTSRTAPSKEEPSLESSGEEFLSGDGSEKVERVLEVWRGLEGADRPSRRRAEGWLREWSDEAALIAELHRLRERGYLANSINYVQACLASALRRSRLPAPVGPLIAEMAALARRDPPEPFDLAGRLARLAAALPADLPPEVSWGEAIRGLEGEPEAVQDALGHLEDRLAAAIEERLGPEGRARLDERVAANLRPVAERIRAAERPRIEATMRRRLLRREAGLPELSLFGPAAEHGDPGKGDPGDG